MQVCHRARHLRNYIWSFILGTISYSLRQQHIAGKFSFVLGLLDRQEKKSPSSRLSLNPLGCTYESLNDCLGWHLINLLDPAWKVRVCLYQSPASRRLSSGSTVFSSTRPHQVYKEPTTLSVFPPSMSPTMPPVQHLHLANIMSAHTSHDNPALHSCLMMCSSVNPIVILYTNCHE